MALESPLGRARDFIKNDAMALWAALCDTLQPGFAIPVLLSGILLTLREQMSNNRPGGNTIEFIPVQLKANAPQQILDRSKIGRARKVSVWTDNWDGLPSPQLRIGTSGASVSAGGVLLAGYSRYDIGVIPERTSLYAVASVDMALYVIVET